MLGPVEFIEGILSIHGKPIILDTYQKKILNDDGEFRYVNKSRRIGLTQIIAWEALYRALMYKNTWVAIVSVSERVAKDVMTYVKDAFNSYTDYMVSVGKADLIPKTGANTKTEIVFVELNSKIQSLPTNPKTLRGSTITDLYLDEFAHYQNAEEVYGAILPSISLDRDHITSRVTMVSTPLSKFGPYYEFWANRELPEYQHISYYTIHWSECERLKKKIKFIKASMDDDQFRREFCNEFIDELLAALPFKDIQPCIDDNLTNEFDLSKTRNPIYIGIDYGKIRDSTVIVVVEKTETEFIVRHVREFEPPISYKEAADFINSNVPKWKPSRIVLDDGGPGQSTIEDLSDLGSLVKGETLTQPYKQKIFIFLKRCFQDRTIRIPKNDKLINQLHAIQKKVTETGMIRYTHPAKGLIKHDDYVWALALAVYAGEIGSNIGGGGIGLGRSVWEPKRSRDRVGVTFKY